MTLSDPRVAGVELGGTKSIAVIACGVRIVDRLKVVTTTPGATLAALSDWIAANHATTPVAAIGIASFGPLDLDPRSPGFGRILATPKPGWSDTDVCGAFARRFAVPIGFDTDVTAAALAEGQSGAAQGCNDHVYLTIGTGVGVGVIAGGRPVHGSAHPEAGHIRVRRRVGDAFAGVCPFHGDCLEGLVSGPALARRTGRAGDAIPDDHPVWTAFADEVAELMVMLLLTLAPQRIVVGGGVVERRAGLLPAIRARMHDVLGGYLAAGATEALAQTIVAPRLGGNAGALGAAQLAIMALSTPIVKLQSTSTAVSEI